MKAVRLLAWNEEEREERARELERAGYEVISDPADPGKLLRQIRLDPPAAVVIDLSRSPALGRDLGVALRVQVSTRHVPLLFAGGRPEKAKGIKEVLPDAEFVSWEDVGVGLERAMHHPPKNPVAPDSVFAGYSGTPLPKKLGIKESSRVLLAGAPPDFPATLGTLPPGVTLSRRYGPNIGLILWFVRSRRELEGQIGKWASRVGKEGIWICWPKKSSGLGADLQQNDVRQTGLKTGLVDYKIAAVDQTWSGLKFAVRKKKATPS